jgi:hypothetical protein
MVFLSLWDIFLTVVSSVIISGGGTFSVSGKTKLAIIPIKAKQANTTITETPCSLHALKV